MKLEFTNLPPDANTHRLHQGLSSVIPSEVTCDIHQVKIAYGTLHGKATGYGSVSLRNVPANESVMKSIRESQANGSWKFGSARVAYDDRRDAQLGEPILPRLAVGELRAGRRPRRALHGEGVIMYSCAFPVAHGYGYGALGELGLCASISTT